MVGPVKTDAAVSSVSDPEALGGRHSAASLTSVLSLLQDLPSEDVDQELIEEGQWEEILRKPCPSQYSTIKEEDVRAASLLSSLSAFLRGLLVFAFALGKGNKTHLC